MSRYATEIRLLQFVKILVKAWGDSSRKPVLVTHARMDNAGSFDLLIPLLPESFYYICIDLPSHGKSSHLPPFHPVSFLHFILVYKLVLDYFKRDRYIIVGHSFGAGIGNHFARLYPKYVEKIIGLDTPIQLVPIENCTKVDRTNYDKNIQIYNKQDTGKRPAYTEAQVIEKIRCRSWKQMLSVEVATNLSKRLLDPNGKTSCIKCIAQRLYFLGNDRYHLSTDQRVMNLMPPLYDDRYNTDVIRLYPVSCPYLFILCRKTASMLLSATLEALNEVEKWNKVKIQWVDGGHDVHMLNPKIVAPIISEFLLETPAKM